MTDEEFLADFMMCTVSELDGYEDEWHVDGLLNLIKEARLQGEIDSQDKRKIIAICNTHGRVIPMVTFDDPNDPEASFEVCPECQGPIMCTSIYNLNNSSLPKYTSARELIKKHNFTEPFEEEQKKNFDLETRRR